MPRRWSNCIDQRGERSKKTESNSAMRSPAKSRNGPRLRSSRSRRPTRGRTNESPSEHFVPLSSEFPRFRGGRRLHRERAVGPYTRPGTVEPRQTCVPKNMACLSADSSAADRPRERAEGLPLYQGRETNPVSVRIYATGCREQSDVAGCSL